jgi:hypothetical protein
MALEVRDALGALTATWSRLGHDIGFGIGIAHGFATLGTIGFEGRFDYAAIGTVSNVASRLCDEAKPGQILISPRTLTKIENAVQVEPVGEFELKGIRRPLGHNVVVVVPAEPDGSLSATQSRRRFLLPLFYLIPKYRFAAPTHNGIRKGPGPSLMLLGELCGIPIPRPRCCCRLCAGCGAPHHHDTPPVRPAA